MDIFEETNFIEKIVNDRKEKLYCLKKEEEEEIKKISFLYDKKMKEIEENILLLSNALSNKRKIISNESIFDIDDIATVLSYLLSKIENEEYIYRKIEIKQDIIYVLEKLNKENYKTVILKHTKKNIDNKIIKFYDSNLREMVDFKDFSYLYDFINYVIKYKVKNKKYDLSLDELNYLLDEYLNFNKQNKLIKRYTK